MDRLIKGITKNGFLRIYAVDTTETVNRAVTYHGLSPVCAAALGRLMTAGVMMGEMLKGNEPTLTLQVKGDGPIGLMVSVSDSFGSVKGYCENPAVDIPLNAKGKLDVGGAVGKNGVLGVIKDLKMKEPYIGQVPLSTGEIGDDIAFYFMQSEQTPSVVSLGVLVDVDYSIKCAGGFIIQVMPECDEKTLSRLENSIKDMLPVTEMLSRGMSLEEIVRYVMLGFDVEILEENEVGYKCDCSRERMERAIVSLGREQIKEIIDETGEAEICCHFCSRKYKFETPELTEFLKRAR
ncbi:MAG TPA: Hsp33 family molecular chaperone HslO [Candidatus Monoglobus merdigallinarum]|uniref:33 kDa chaperonin n=1 Tax=Candidatus Monoglobus merdigallinarum TaxID=2838698 RepID=A0A9D1TLH1_9FIRM|nr:Hsp33 family molecular chaperone HslO [Candidatus Monoglobus merdigallinarum]